MTQPGDGSTRTGRTDPTPTGTRTGHDVAAHMTGERTVVRPTGQVRDTTVTHRESGLGRHKTSAAAVFALVFGLAALFCGLTGLLAPAAVLFGLIGLVLGAVGLSMSKRPGVTGHGVAVGGLVTSLLGLLLGAAVLGGLAFFVNDESAVSRLESGIERLKDNLPSGSEVTDRLPAG